MVSVSVLIRHFLGLRLFRHSFDLSDRDNIAPRYRPEASPIRGFAGNKRHCQRKPLSIFGNEQTVSRHQTILVLWLLKLRPFTLNERVVPSNSEELFHFFRRLSLVGPGMSQPATNGTTSNARIPIPPISTNFSRTLHRLSGASMTSPAFFAETTAPVTAEVRPAARIGTPTVGFQAAAAVATAVVTAPTVRPSLIGVLEHAVVRIKHALTKQRAG